MNVDFFKLFTLTLDVILVWLSILFIYKIISVSIRKLYIIFSLVTISILKLLVETLDLPTINLFLDYIFNLGPLIIIILFHDDIKNSLESIGRNSFNFKYSKLSIKSNQKDMFWHKLDYSLRELSSLKMGALITIENEDNLDNQIKIGTIIDSEFSSELVKNLFNPKFSTLHDGGMIIRDKRIASVNNYYPLQTDISAKFEHGTRHRAALSLSQVSDSITFIVSEETSKISVSFRNKIIELNNGFHSYEVINDLLNLSKRDSYEK